MSPPAIRVESLGKLYRIGQRERRRDTLLGAGLSWLASPLTNFRNLRDLRRLDPDDDNVLWALRDVSFDVDEGEVVGIIGRNGAGKSTLLKILSRITDPTYGRIELRGRVASLLEVGTGFHPELTGRENVYLNGTVLGMTKREVDRKFEEIVDFAGVERFIDTPVKRYSSGMKVRLAFAVAAHLDPEILVVDEVLAVGDIEFQKKCLGKMETVGRSGRTVLFVSHDLGAVRRLCPRTILLESGALDLDGQTEAVLSRYAAPVSEGFGALPEGSPIVGDGGLSLVGGRLRGSSAEPTSELVAGERVAIEMDYRCESGVGSIEILATIYDAMDRAVSNVSSELTGSALKGLGSAGRLRCTIPRLPLLPGRYRIAVAVKESGRSILHEADAFHLDVVGSVFHGTSLTPNSRYATVMIEHEWAVVPDPIRSGMESTL